MPPLPQLPKPHTIDWPLTPKSAEDIDYNFDLLFRQVQQNAQAGVLSVSGGGTGLGSFTKGDLLYAETPTTIAGLHDVVPGNVLVSGGVGLAPLYGKVALSGVVTHITGVLPILNGGTGQTTKTEAFDALAPTTTKGDLIVHNGSDNIRLGVGVNGQALVADSAQAAGVKWASAGQSNLLQSDVHLDTLTQTRVLGDLVAALSPTAFGGFWMDGAELDFIATTAPTAGEETWIDGASIDGIFAAGSVDDVRWQRFPIGPAGSFLKSSGLIPVWEPIGDVGEVTASAQPRVKVRKTGNQTIPDGGDGTTIAFDVEQFDTDDFWTIGTPSRLTVPLGKAGTYLVVAQGSWETAAAGRRCVWIFQNGVRQAIGEATGDDGGFGLSFPAATFLVLAVGDYVELVVRQDTGGDLDIIGDLADVSLTHLQMYKIA